MATIRLSPQLGRFCAKRTSLEITKGTVREALDQMTVEYPGLSGVLFNKDGEVQPYLAFFLDGSPLYISSGEPIALRPESTLFILSGVAGG